MEREASHIAVIGFGEAGQTFATHGQWRTSARVYDRLTEDDGHRAAKLAHYEAAGVIGCVRLADAVATAQTLISLVTADQALVVAQACAALMVPGSLYLDINSVSPSTKRLAAEAVTAAGGHYVDVAVMAPVQPAALDVPLMVSGPRAEEAAQRLTALGFTKVRLMGDEVGRASSIKMIRSVMVKGIEALSAECVLAAQSAGVLDEVLASLDASWPGADWATRADYNLDRMMVHGTRRSAEMQEVVRTLDDLGTGSDMSRGTVTRQARIGALGLQIPPQGLSEKIASVLLERAHDQ